MTCGSKLPEAGDTGIIVGGTIEFAGAHRGCGGGGSEAPPGGGSRKGGMEDGQGWC